jgi:hypothetical protein
VTAWCTVTIEYRGLRRRRDLLTNWLPAFISTIGIEGPWFFADTVTPADLTDPDATRGEIEIAIDVGARDAKAIEDLVRASLADSFATGAVSGLGSLPRPRLLDPILFAGSIASMVYAGLLNEGTRRAIAILRELDPPLSTVTSEVEAVLGLLDPEQRVVLADNYATWLEAVAQRRATSDDAPAPRSVTATSTTPPTPYGEALVAAFTEETGSLPLPQRSELVARLAHIQAMRLDPTISLADEAALVRSLLPGFAHRATPRAAD